MAGIRERLRELNRQGKTQEEITQTLIAMTIAGRRPELWKPFALKQQEMTPVGDHNYVSIGRLKPGVSIAAAQSELHVVMARIRAQIISGTDLDAAVVPCRIRWSVVRGLPLS